MIPYIKEMKPLIVLIFVVLGCDSKKGVKLEPLPRTDTDFSSLLVTINTASTLFAVYLDSVNSVDSLKLIPSFLYNDLLDYENPWVTDHGTFSLRKMLFESTTNTYLLKRILESDDIRFGNISSFNNSVADKHLFIRLSPIQIFQLMKWQNKDSVS